MFARPTQVPDYLGYCSLCAQWLSRGDHLRTGRFRLVSTACFWRNCSSEKKEHHFVQSVICAVYLQSSRLWKGCEHYWAEETSVRDGLPPRKGAPSLHCNEPGVPHPVNPNSWLLEHDPYPFKSDYSSRASLCAIQELGW